MSCLGQTEFVVILRFGNDSVFDSVCVMVEETPAADLGMFSMFGRTGAPTKGGPTKGAANFLHAGNTEIMGDHRVNNESKDQKRSPVFQEN